MVPTVPTSGTAHFLGGLLKFLLDFVLLKTKVLQGTPCEPILTRKNLLSLQGTLFSLQGPDFCCSLTVCHLVSQNQSVFFTFFCFHLTESLFWF